MILIWVSIFVVSLILLVKSSDWLLDSAEKIGWSFGMSPFLIGITILAVGTSLPELVSSLFAVYEGVTEIVVANAVGSNIANILLIIGICAIVTKKLHVTKDLINLDLPLVALSTALFFMVAQDFKVTFLESCILIFAYISYVVFSVFMKEEEIIEEPKNKEDKTAGKREYILLIVGVIGLAISANYLIKSVIALSEIFSIAPSLISITAVAIGTSLPELLVSIKAALAGKSESALGNIFGSNVFNVLGVVGIPGLFATLSIDQQTFTLGVPLLILATVLFVISGISRKIHLQEGIFYLCIYFVFIGKLFNLF
jgi:cation:H+ antiporter